MSRRLEATEPLPPLDRRMKQTRGAAARLDAIAYYVDRCIRCDLYENRKHAIAGEGPPTAALMIVGEGPGREEDEQGRPFVGPSGRLLNRMLALASIERVEAFITNVVKCRPVQRAGGRLRNRTPWPPEIKACRPYLERQAAVIRPRAILCLGGTAGKGVIGESFNISRDRGNWYETAFGAPALATFHPSYIVRKGGAGWTDAQLREAVGHDLRQVKAALAGS